MLPTICATVARWNNQHRDDNEDNKEIFHSKNPNKILT